MGRPGNAGCKPATACARSINAPCAWQREQRVVGDGDCASAGANLLRAALQSLRRALALEPPVAGHGFVTLVTNGPTTVACHGPGLTAPALPPPTRYRRRARCGSPAAPAPVDAVAERHYAFERIEHVDFGIRPVGAEVVDLPPSPRLRFLLRADGKSSATRRR